MNERKSRPDWLSPTEEASVEFPSVPGYEILQELGRGGMGVVYKARQLSAERVVALKMIRDSALAGPQERSRFRIEAEAAARMRHRNIIQIFEIGDHAGLPFFAMQLVEGGSLAKWIADSSGAPVSMVDGCVQAVQLLLPIVQAMHHAHQRGIVHRDLKPANILLELTPSSVQYVPAHRDNLQNAVPVVTDFGLAKRLDDESTALTQPGAILGTAAYMAPEQAAGRTHETGPAVDVYALGAILYELLTGRPPFQSESWNETVQQVMHDEPTPPKRLRPDVPCDLETICLKCLEKEPERRYASAEALGNDLTRFLEGSRVAAVAPTELERLARVAERDGYQIVGEIGRGPRSIVYRAVYERLEQPVALKVFPAWTCTRDEWEARLRRGREHESALAHPHIVPVHRTGWWNGAPYLALEFVPQGSLADKLTGRPFPVFQAVRLVERLAEIVAYIHRQGVVHGNLKPSNVLLSTGDLPRVADFYMTGGLYLSPLAEDNQEPNGIGYLSPERVSNPEVELRVPADIYGLGLILYELLTGRPPFIAETARETRERVLSEEPISPASLNSDVTPRLAAFCLHCLRKNPWERFVRAYDLQKRLRYYLNDQEGRSRPDRGDKRGPLKPDDLR